MTKVYFRPRISTGKRSENSVVRFFQDAVSDYRLRRPRPRQHRPTRRTKLNSTAREGRVPALGGPVGRSSEVFRPVCHHSRLPQTILSSRRSGGRNYSEPKTETYRSCYLSASAPHGDDTTDCRGMPTYDPDDVILHSTAVFLPFPPTLRPYFSMIKCTLCF